MPRLPNSPNTCYNYELTIDGESTYLRTCKCLAERLELSMSTVRKKLKDPTMELRKYHGRDLTIIRVKVPIFKRALIAY